MIIGVTALAHPVVSAHGGGLGPDAPAKVRRLLKDIPLNEPLEDGLQWRRIQVSGKTIRVRLTDSKGKEVAALVLGRLGKGETGGETTPSFQITRVAPEGHPEVRRHLDDAIASLRAHDDGQFWRKSSTRRDHGADPSVERERPEPGAVDVIPVRTSPSPQEDDWHPAMQSLIAAGVLLVMLVLWFAVLRRRGEEISMRGLFRADILVPITLQLAILSYWSLYWDGVTRHIPAIAATLAFGLALDLLLRLAIRSEGLFHLAVFPVVLSMHLFVWFEREDFWLGFLVVTIALGSKVAFKRDGRHIFNPSALGIAVVGLLCYLAPDTFRYVDIAHPFNLPPNMFEVVLCLAIVAQWRVPIVLVSIGVALVQWLAVMVAGPGAMIPSIHWAPVTLAVVLLATDPATIPRTGVGRLLFGACYGALMVTSSVALESNGISDFFTKVLPIPVCNALVPALDRFAERAGQRWNDLLEARWNHAHLAIWLALMILPWAWTDTKAHLFEGRFHAIHGTRHVVVRQSTATCEDNPAFCAPLSLGQEITLWLGDPESDP
ncbi:MAG: RnfABCDGE type electron transport complex subunit D [Myxococcota bacterium]|nr:RnfABCDGE type electron transport complex subunit D [Myxococcota bacterium]